MATVLITGASRGIGLEFARQYAADGWTVLATARDPGRSAALGELVAASGGRVLASPLDVTDPAAITALAGQLAGTSIDVLVNNAGTMGANAGPGQGMLVQRFGKSNYADWVDQFAIHALAPMRMAEAFVTHLAASAERKIVTITSLAGSISENTLGGMYAYRSTKAAANAIVRSLARDLARRGIISVSMHPGWVVTDIGGPNAPVTVGASVTGMRAVIGGLTAAESGRFWQYDGQELSW